MTKHTATKRARTPRSGESPELIEYTKMQHARLKRAMGARSEAVATLHRAIASSKEGQAMLAEGEQLVVVLARVRRDLSEGRVTRLQIDREQGKAVQAFEDKYRELTDKAWLKVAAESPTIYEMYRAFYDDEKIPRALNVQLLYYLGFIFRHWPKNVPDDTGSTQQAVMQPLDVSATSFDLEIVQDHTDVFSFAMSFASPSGGNFSVFPQAGTTANVPGVASGRALVGTEFTFPPGFTQFSVSADIDWNYNLSTWVVFGGAGCGADLLLRIEPGSGANAMETLLPLASVVAPVVWGAGADGMGSSTVALSLTLTDPAPEDLKVFAGATCHAEAEGTEGASSGSVAGKVKRIAIHAT